MWNIWRPRGTPPPANRGQRIPTLSGLLLFRRGFALFLAVLIAAPMFGQQKPPAASSPTFTARSELVLVPAVVRDKAGRHIGQLKKEDFTVLENGVPQKITVFEEIAAGPGRIRRAQPKDGEFTNFLEGDATPKRVIIILLDTINTPIAYQPWAREDLVKFLSNRSFSDEPIALLTLGRGGVKVIHDFATDPRVLVAALKKVRGGLSNISETELIDEMLANAAYAQQELEAVADFVSPRSENQPGRSSSGDGAGSDGTGQKAGAGRPQGRGSSASRPPNRTDQILIVQRRGTIRQTLEALQLLARALEGIPGRKALLWVSAGFPFSIDLNASLEEAGSELSVMLPLYQRTWQMLNNANVGLYPVDVRGLVNPMFVGASVGKVPPAPYGSIAMSGYQDGLHTMRTFADATGGRTCYDNNDLNQCFQQAEEDSASYYMLGYYLRHSQPKPGWRKLEVKVQRPGARVRARQGFFDTKTTQSPDATKAADLDLAVRSPLDYTGLLIVAKWIRISGTTTKRVEFEIGVPPAAALVDKADNNHLSVEFLAVAKKGAGEVAAQVSKKSEGRLKLATSALVKKAGLVFRNSFELPPGEYTVRFVVRDNLTGRMGSVLVPLSVAP